MYLMCVWLPSSYSISHCALWQSHDASVIADSYFVPFPHYPVIERGELIFYCFPHACAFLYVSLCVKYPFSLLSVSLSLLVYPFREMGYLPKSSRATMGNSEHSGNEFWTNWIATSPFSIVSNKKGKPEAFHNLFSVSSGCNQFVFVTFMPSDIGNRVWK